MRKLATSLAVAFLLAACTWSGTYLAPPPDATGDSSAISQDMTSCESVARTGQSLSSQDLQLVDGKETARLFMSGRLVVNPDGNPAFHQSLVPQRESAYADRYAVCLLKRGYTWQEK
jgi:hypothetical protein